MNAYKITGHDAIRLAERDQLTLRCHANPIDTRQAVTPRGPGVWAVTQQMIWGETATVIAPAGGTLRREIRSALRVMRPIDLGPATLMAAAHHNPRRLALLTPAGSIAHI